MKRNWIFSTLAAVVLLTTLVVFITDDNFLAAKEQPVNEDITSTQPEVSDINNDYPKDIRLTESQRKMCESNNDFACNLFRSICEQKGGDTSTIVSPISVSYVLGMLNEGAGGETRRQITDVLGLGGSVQEINQYFKKMMAVYLNRHYSRYRVETGIFKRWYLQYLNFLYKVVMK